MSETTLSEAERVEYARLSALVAMIGWTPEVREAMALLYAPWLGASHTSEIEYGWKHQNTIMRADREVAESLSCQSRDGRVWTRVVRRSPWAAVEVYP